jgi:DoxX-like family
MNGKPGTVDAEYRFGKSKVYLTPIEIARLTILRSRLGDINAERAAERIPSFERK